DPDHTEARALQADAFEQLGYQAESGPWRDFYLTGAQELRHGAPQGLGGSTAGRDVVTAMTPEMLFGYLGVRLDGLAAAERTFGFTFVVTDRGGETWSIGVEHGAIDPVAGRPHVTADATVRSTHEALAALALGSAPLAELEQSGNLSVDGDRPALEA